MVLTMFLKKTASSVYWTLVLYHFYHVSPWGIIVWRVWLFFLTTLYNIQYNVLRFWYSAKSLSNLLATYSAWPRQKDLSDISSLVSPSTIPFEELHKRLKVQCIESQSIVVEGKQNYFHPLSVSAAVKAHLACHLKSCFVCKWHSWRVSRQLCHLGPFVVVRQYWHVGLANCVLTLLHMYRTMYRVLFNSTLIPVYCNFYFLSFTI